MRSPRGLTPGTRGSRLKDSHSRSLRKASRKARPSLSRNHRNSLNHCLCRLPSPSCPPMSQHTLSRPHRASRRRTALATRMALNPSRTRLGGQDMRTRTPARPAGRRAIHATRTASARGTGIRVT